MPVDNLAKIDVWKLARMEGDYDEPCQILSCDQAARAVIVISYSDGCASVRNYCSGARGQKPHCSLSQPQTAVARR